MILVTAIVVMILVGAPILYNGPGEWEYGDEVQFTIPTEGLTTKDLTAGVTFITKPWGYIYDGDWATDVRDEERCNHYISPGDDWVGWARTGENVTLVTGHNEPCGEGPHVHPLLQYEEEQRHRAGLGNHFENR